MQTSGWSGASAIGTMRSTSRSRLDRKASRSAHAGRSTTCPFSVRTIQPPPSEAVGQGLPDPPLPSQPLPPVEGASPTVHIRNRDLDQVPQLVHASLGHRVTRLSGTWYLE